MNTGAGRKSHLRLVRPSGLFLTIQKNNKMDIFSSFATDEALETEGKWFPLSKTASIRVARAGNPKYVELLRSKMKESQIELSSGKEADDIAEAILVDVMAESILLDWKGLTYRGNPAPVSVKQAKVFLALKDFRKKVASLSENFDSFRVKEEVEQGNA